MAQKLKAGTRIETLGTNGIGGSPAVAPETGRIGRWGNIHGETNCARPGGEAAWHVVIFDRGGTILMHESSFRVI